MVLITIFNIDLKLSSWRELFDRGPRRDSEEELRDVDITLQPIGSTSAVAHIEDSQTGDLFYCFPNVMVTNNRDQAVSLLPSCRIPLVEPNPLGKPEVIARLEPGAVQSVSAMARSRQIFLQGQQITGVFPVESQRTASGHLVFCVKSDTLRSLDGDVGKYERRRSKRLVFEDQLTHLDKELPVYED